MKQSEEIEVTQFISPETKAIVKSIAELKERLFRNKTGCVHKIQGETPDGETGKRRVCLICGAEQESTSNHYWTAATKTFVKGGEYDDHDWHYTIEARLDKVSKLQVYNITWDELHKLRNILTWHNAPPSTAALAATEKCT